MKSARFRRVSRRRLVKLKKENKNVSRRFLKIIFPLVILTGILLYFIFGRINWTGEDKLSLVYRMDNGDAAVVVIDPVLSEITRLVISGDTEVSVARNYGTLRLKNVWQLGVNEKMEGNLLASTVAKNFLFPVFLWSDSDADCLIESDILCLTKFVFNPKDTNIPFWDRASISLFSLRVKSLDKTTIDLVQAQYLKKQTLSDGEKGYKLFGSVPQRLTVYFNDPKLAANLVRIHIIDGTGTSGIAQNVGQILEVIGGKVVSIDRTQNAKDKICSVTGKNRDAVNKVILLFGCTSLSGGGEYDLEVTLGKDYAGGF